jgi:hypothetical protein
MLVVAALPGRIDQFLSGCTVRYWPPKACLDLSPDLLAANGAFLAKIGVSTRIRLEHSDDIILEPPLAKSLGCHIVLREGLPPSAPRFIPLGEGLDKRCVYLSIAVEPIYLRTLLHVWQARLCLLTGDN